MGSNRDERRKLFDVYSDQLRDAYPKADGRYGCPICLRLFERDTVDDLLTLEHVIPKRLGKRLTVLTCKTCNNVGGAKLDSQLHKELAVESFLKGSGEPIGVELKIGEQRVAANWERRAGEGGMQNNFRVVAKATAPDELLKGEQLLKSFSMGDEINVKFEIASEKRARISELKAGYLLAFRTFRYRYILHKNLELIRQQIQRPAEELVPLGALILTVNRPAHVNCVVTLNGPEQLNAIFAVLELGSPKMGPKHRGILLPAPDSPSDFFEQARALKHAGGQLSVDGAAYVR